jgi:endonuclease/exonuclease/phosphatase family metal-dependent hydrolase
MRVFTIIFLLYSSMAFASHPITIDGLFDDWQDVSIRVGDINNFLVEDFAKLQITNDEKFLYICFEFHQNEYLLQGENNITLLIDADNDKETGHPISEMGVEVEWCFGCRSGNYYVMDGIIQIQQFDVILRSAPTVTSKKFEIAIGLDSWPMQQENSAKSDTVKILLSNSNGSDTVPDDKSGFEYVVDSTLVPPPEEITLAKNDFGHLRIMTYNTLANGLFDPDRQPHFERIIRAIEADVMAFQEQSGHASVKSLISKWLQTEHFFSIQLGNNNIVVSRYPILDYGLLTRSGRTMAVLLATKSIIGKNLLLLNSHLACCTNNSSRQNDADEIISVLRNWRTGNGLFDLEPNTPIVHVGDFNLVGDSQQLLTLTDGDIVNEAQYGPDFFPDWDNTPFVDLFSRHTSIRMGYTWRDDNSSFNPGKLDYILYSDSNIQIGKHFVLNTLSMSRELLSRKGLIEDDTQNASDHLPRVMDIAGLQLTQVSGHNVQNLPKDYSLFSVFPNPFNQSTKIQFYLEKQQHVKLAIYNLRGQEVEQILNSEMFAGQHSILWDAKNNPSGVYFCKIQAGIKTRTIKVLLQN